MIKPYWEGKSLEDVLKKNYGKEFDEISRVVKINQKDHAQGHICPNVALWLKKGPKGLKEDAMNLLAKPLFPKLSLAKDMRIVYNHFKNNQRILRCPMIAIGNLINKVYKLHRLSPNGVGDSLISINTGACMTG